MKKNISLTKVLGPNYLFATTTTKICNRGCFTPVYTKSFFNLSQDDTSNCFFDFVKRSYNDLRVCWADEREYTSDGERTLFCEVFIQQFKLFSKIIKSIKFKWAKKK
jgi:hypothetical protein